MRARWILLAGCLVYLRTCCGELKLLQAVFRHGNRTPISSIDFYPEDPYVNETYEPAGFGGLTNEGKMSAYELGLFFRDTYGKFLGDMYKSSIVWFRADEVERVIMTAQLVAAALFPPNEIQTWNPELNWQPIPVWFVPFNKDVLYNGVYCTNHKMRRSEVERKDAFLQKWQIAHADLYEYLSENAGGNITQQYSFYIRQKLAAQLDIGLELPDWTKPIFPGILDEVAAFDLIVQSYTTEMQQLLGGVWILEWLNHVDSFLKGYDTRKAFMYGCHELNIAPILIALKSFDYKLPSYSATIMFELHQQHERYYVQVHHKDAGVLRTLRIPGCDNEMCPLDIFKKITAPLIPTNAEDLCGEISFDNIF